jgi:uncharacterized membrane protein YagU involved in acid resistance
MNVLDTLIWGGIATGMMTAILEGAMYLGWTRMSLPFILGTLVTSNRRLAPAIGAVLHLVNGCVFAFGYALAFESLGRATWWIGLLLGAAHSTVVLALLPFIAGIHPRMATESDGPDARRALQPPGYFGLNYGRRTPLFGLLSHLVFGLIMGTFYPLG